jgi:hypothetical protein
MLDAAGDQGVVTCHHRQGVDPLAELAHARRHGLGRQVIHVLDQRMAANAGIGFSRLLQRPPECTVEG